MAEWYLPVPSHFENGNPWTASAGRLRFRILPDTSAGLLRAEVWEGPWAYEFSQVEEQQEFPLSQDGLTQICIWLDRWKSTLETRPAPTLQEDIARREAVLARNGPQK